MSVYVFVTFAAGAARYIRTPPYGVCRDVPARHRQNRGLPQQNVGVPDRLLRACRDYLSDRQKSGSGGAWLYSCFRKQHRRCIRQGFLCGAFGSTCDYHDASIPFFRRDRSVEQLGVRLCGALGCIYYRFVCYAAKKEPGHGGACARKNR